MEDIEFQTGRITVLHGKNDVSRIVVASSSLLEEMRAYHRKYLQDAALESHFLHGPKSSRYNESMLYGKFRRRPGYLQSLTGDASACMMSAIPSA